MVTLCVFAALLAGQATPAYLHRLAGQKDFDALSRPTDYPYPQPHIFFLVDRQQKNEIYYANSKRFESHRAFANGTYLSLEKGQRFFQDNYLRPDRRFYMGTLAYQSPVKKWTYEFWEGDSIDRAGILTVDEAVRKSFFAPVAFKPNSLHQEETTADATGLVRLLPSEIVKPGPYMPISIGKTLGRIHIVAHYSESTVINPDDIVILAEAPVTLAPVAGIITTRPASPLAHISLRSKSMGVPDAFIEHADRDLARYDGKIVSFVTKPDQYLIGIPTAKELEQFNRRETHIASLRTPKADLTVAAIADLKDQRAGMATIYGSKSANLGEMFGAHLAECDIPDGFSLPFAAYRNFLTANGLDRKIAQLLADPKILADAVYRKNMLAELRKSFGEAKVDPALAVDVLRRAHARFSGQGLFVRSSTNSEDLPNFNGAGLYSTFPNARTDEQILQAIKFVWGSVWNLEAFDARTRARIDHTQVYMGVLIQRGVNAESAGVMVTGNPFDTGDRDCCYISATKGLGIKVVEGLKVPEQLLLHYESGGVQVLTRSSGDTLLTFNENGGLKELITPEGRSVLTDDLTHRLSRVARRVQSLFGHREQDIEWAIMGGKIYIVQARPYLREP